MSEQPEQERHRLPDANDVVRFYIGLLIVLILSSGFIVLGLDALGLTPDDQLFVAIASVLQGTITVGVIALIVKTRNLDWRRSLRLLPCSPKTIILACIGIIPLGILVSQFAEVLVQIFPTLLSQNLLDLVALSAFGNPAIFLVFVLALSFAPGITEELAFRGIILRGLESSISPTAAILVSAFVFALFHLDPLHIIMAFPAGIFFGYLVIRTGSIFPAIAAHIFNNIWAPIESAVWQASSTTLGPAEVLFGGGYAPWTIAVVTGIFIAALYFLHQEPDDETHGKDDGGII